MNKSMSEKMGLPGLKKQAAIDDEAMDSVDPDMIEPAPLGDEMSLGDDASEPSVTAGAGEAAKGAGISGKPGALIAEKLGKTPEEGKKLLDAAMSVPANKSMTEADLADKMGKDLMFLLKIEGIAAGMTEEQADGDEPVEDMPADEPAEMPALDAEMPAEDEEDEPSEPADDKQNPFGGM